jgi:hypothetical protein
MLSFFMMVKVEVGKVLYKVHAPYLAYSGFMDLQWPHQGA